MKIQIDDLAKTIQKELEHYQKITDEHIKDTVREVGKETKEHISHTAPKKSEKYSRSWAVKVMKENSHAMSVVVHSKNKYQLTHLLEFGHVKRNGGRTKAFPHLGEAEQKAIQSFEEKVQEILNNG